MSLRQVYRIARREYIALVRNKAFVITTLMVPAFLAFYVLVMPQFFQESGDRSLTVAILDGGTGLGEELRVRLEELDMVRVEFSKNRLMTVLFLSRGSPRRPARASSA